MASNQPTADVLPFRSPDATRRVESVKQVRSAVVRKLHLLMEGLCVNAEDALFEEMRDLDEERALATHFNVMRALRTEWPVLCREFVTQLNRSWVVLAQRKDRQAVADAPADMTPTLKAYSDRNLNHYKILLEEVRVRFSLMVGGSVAFHPLLPGNLYLCFWHATEAVDLTYQERKLMVALFHRFVMDRFGQLAAAANQQLVHLGMSVAGRRLPGGH